MIHLTLQERKVLLFLVFLFSLGLILNISAKTRAKKEDFSGGYLSRPVCHKVDINRADRSQLVDLPGIGEKTAQTIIAYRQAHGPFKNLDDLKAIKGIGEKKLERLKGHLVVNK